MKAWSKEYWLKKVKGLILIFAELKVRLRNTTFKHNIYACRKCMHFSGRVGGQTKVDFDNQGK